MKKSILIITLLLIGLSLFSQPQRIADSDTYWEFRNDTLFITGTGDMPDYKTPEPNRPWEHITSPCYLKIADGITRIGESSFTELRNLIGTLEIPSSVTSIGHEAFFRTGFTGNLTIPSSVISIETTAFSYCSGFTGDLNIPSSVTQLGSGAFLKCTGLDGTLTLSSSLTVMAGSTFSHCNFTGTLILPPSITKIQGGDFVNCNGFTGTLTIPSSVSYIGSYTFEGCSGLTSLILPADLDSIEVRAFKGCIKLDTITNLNPTPITIDTSVFAGINKEACILRVNTEYLSLYQQAPVWQDFLIEGVPGLKIKEIEKQDVHLFPNPVKDILNIQTVSTLEQVAFYDITGRIVKQFYHPNHELTISDLPSGMYLVKIVTLEGESVRKIIKD